MAGKGVLVFYLLVFIVIAVVDSQNIVSTTFAIREYYQNKFTTKETSVKGNGVFSLGQELAFIETTFDEDIYININENCSAWFNDSRPPQYTPCGSFSLYREDFICLDSGNDKEIFYRENEKSIVIFQSKVSNPESCSYVALSHSALFGDPDFFIDFGNSSLQVYDLDDILQLSSGGSRPPYLFRSYDSGYIICCSDVRSVKPDWDGNIHFIFVHNNETAYRVNPLPENPIVPLNDWFWNIKLKIECDVDGFSCQYPCNISDCCPKFSVNAATEEPFFNYITRGPADILKPMVYNSVITEFILAEKSSTTDCVYLPGKILPHCYIGYENLLTADGTPIEFELSRLEEADNPVCSFQRFQAVSKDFDQVMEKLNEVSGSDDNEVQNLISSALAIVTGDDWQGCIKKAENLLSPQPSTLKRTTTVCQWDQTEDAYKYSIDPCCNRTLLSYQCCASVERTYNINEYQTSSDKLSNSCTQPKCSEIPAKLISSIISNPGYKTNEFSDCIDATKQEISSDKFLSNPVNHCQLFLGAFCGVDAACLNWNSTSKCVNGFCTVSCSEDSDCYGFKCVNNMCDVTNDDDANVTEYVKCLLDRANNYLTVLMQEQLDLIDSREDISAFDKLQDILIPYTCTGVTDYDGNPLTTKELCESTYVCNWTPESTCPSNTNCNEVNCVENIYSENYCSSCSIISGCYEESTFARCRLLTDATNCGRYGYNYNYLKFECFTNATSRNTCLPETICNPAAGATDCGPFCLFPNYLNQTSCQAAGLTWTSWNGWVSGTPQSRCSSTANANNCYNAGGIYVRNRWVSPSVKATEYDCGVCNINGAEVGSVAHDTCLSTKTCTLSACIDCQDNQTACESSGECNDIEGCLIPYSASIIDSCSFNTVACKSGQKWTPKGCIDTSIPEENCTDSIRGVWLEKALTENECLQKFTYCYEGPSSVPPIDISSLLTPPSQFSLKDSGNCGDCGGKAASFYTWKKGEWLTGVWVPYKWIPRQFVNNLEWKRTLTQTAFSSFADLYEIAQLRRFASISKNEFTCRYGQIKGSLERVACDCTSSGNGDCTSGVISLKNAVITACRYTEATISLANVTVYIPEDLQLSKDIYCIDIDQYLIPIDQFEQQKTLKLTGTELYPPLQDEKDSRTSIKNSNGVAVGKVIGDGIGWLFNQSKFQNGTSNPRACISLNVDGLDPLYYYFDLVSSEYPNFEKFEPLYLELPINSTEACVDIDIEKNGTFYFPIALVKDYKSETYFYSWPAPQLGILLLCIILYILYLIAAVVDLILYLYDKALMAKSMLPVAALSLICLMLTDRVIFFLLSLFGGLYKYLAIETILSGLPALFLLSICSLLTTKWAEIYRYKYKTLTLETGQYTNIMLFLNVLLYVVFIILIIVHSVLKSSEEINCRTTELEKEAIRRPEIVAYFYKALFALICMILAFSFCLNAQRIIHVTGRELDVVSSDGSAQTTRKLVILSIICTVALVAQAIHLIVTSIVRSRDVIATAISISVIELGATTALLNLYSKTSDLVKDKTRSRSRSTNSIKMNSLSNARS